MYYIVEFYSNSTSNNYFLFSFEDGTNSISSYRSIFDFIDESKTTFDSFLLSCYRSIISKLFLARLSI